MHCCLYCSKNSIILTKHDYSHDRVGTCSSSTDPSRRPREPSKASSWSLRYVQPPRRVRKPPRRVRGGALEASRSLLEDTLREGFAKAPRAPPFGNDSSDNDKPPGGFITTILEHNLESTTDCYSPESRRRAAVEGHKEGRKEGRVGREHTYTRRGATIRSSAP